MGNKVKGAAPKSSKGDTSKPSTGAKTQGAAIGSVRSDGDTKSPKKMVTTAGEENTMGAYSTIAKAVKGESDF